MVFTPSFAFALISSVFTLHSEVIVSLFGLAKTRDCPFMMYICWAKKIYHLQTAGHLLGGDCACNFSIGLQCTQQFAVMFVTILISDCLQQTFKFVYPNMLRVTGIIIMNFSASFQGRLHVNYLAYCINCNVRGSDRLLLAWRW